MTFKPTFEMYELTQRIGDGDISAVKDLWPLIFDVPFDAKRPVEGILKDLSDRMTELFPPEEPVKQEPEINPDATADLVDELMYFVERVLAPRPDRKRAK